MINDFDKITKSLTEQRFLFDEINHGEVSKWS